MTDAPKESKVEVAKKSSRHLRGTIAETLAGDATHFDDTDSQLIKFHGFYQQDDRDVRRDRRAEGLGKAYQFMVRCAIPGGALTAKQYLALDRLADDYGFGSLRITTRQGIQLHGILKDNLKSTIAGINQSLLTTISACGDVGRNVMACPAPVHGAAQAALRKTAQTIAEQLRPASGAYHEIWLDGDKQVTTQEEEPFYGDRYLPRKFKTGIALGSDNCVDVYTHDIGLIGLLEDDAIVGFNVVVGGGMGMTHGKENTFAKLASPLGYVPVEQAAATARTVAAIFRDHGNRADRRHARLKYLIADWGMDRFRDELRERLEFTLADWRPIPRLVAHTHLGRHRQPDDKWFYGIYVDSGRIRDDQARQVKKALHKIISTHRPNIRLTPHQNLLLLDLDEPAIDAIELVMKEHGMTPADDLPAVRRLSMACPALPTCGLALAESERFMPTVMERFEQELTSLGMREEPITLRMTGCPNGCTRPYTADIALVGRRPGIYHIYVGGGFAGDRAVDLYAPDVAADDVIGVLHPLLESWAKRRCADEGFSDYYQRLLGQGEARQAVTGKEIATRELIETKVLP